MSLPLTAEQSTRAEAERAERAEAISKLISKPAPEIDGRIGHRLTQEGDADRALDLMRDVGAVEQAARRTPIDHAGEVLRYYEFRDLGDEA